MRDFFFVKKEHNYTCITLHQWISWLVTWYKDRVYSNKYLGNFGWMDIILYLLVYIDLLHEHISPVR